MNQIEHSFHCPYCGAGISVLLDPSVPNQQYIEDCEVCCRPLEISCRINEGELIVFNATCLDQ